MLAARLTAVMIRERATSFIQSPHESQWHTSIQTRRGHAARICNVFSSCCGTITHQDDLTTSRPDESVRREGRCPTAGAAQLTGEVAENVQDLRWLPNCVLEHREIFQIPNRRQKK